MATLYFNPQHPTDGVGSEADPYNTLIGKTLSTGNTYLFKKGSVYRPGSGTNAISLAQSSVTISTYGDGARPIVDCGLMNRGASISNDIANITIRGLRITNVGTGTSTRGITNSTTGSSGTVITNITIADCEIDNVLTDAANDCSAIQIWGQGNVIEDCIIRDIATDGIWILGNNFIVRRNRIFSISKDGRGQGDCIQVGGASDGFLIEGNFCDHRNDPNKQSIIVDNAGGISGIIQFNTVYHANDTNATAAIYPGQANTIVRGNYVSGGNVGINSSRAGIRIESNIVINSFNRGIDLGTLGVTCVGNVVIGGQQVSGIGIRYLTAGSTATIKNNIITQFPTGLSLAASAYDEDYNNIYDCATASNRALGVNDLALDPQLDSRYLPRNASLINAGTYLSGYDYNGKECGIPPNIGAVENFAARSTATRTVGSFTPASSSRTIRTRTATI